MNFIQLFFKFILYFFLLFSFSGIVSAEYSAPVKMENLAFKILEKKAVEYESALSKQLKEGLERYIPSTRFHLSVRIFWNPNKLDDIRTTPEKLKRKEGKLPGFPIFVRGEKRTLDYYLGTGSVMRLRVDVLMDDTLPERYHKFIREFVPIQARFVAERGDAVRILKIPFPNEAKKIPAQEDVEIPLTDNTFTSDLVDKLLKEKVKKRFNQTVLIHPVIQKYITSYEKYIIEKLQKIISKYVDPNQFLVNVQFNWNPDQLEKLKGMVLQMDPKGKVKLPGFTIYLEEQNAFYETISSSTEIMKLEVAILLDDPVSKDVDPFLEKIVPLSFKFIKERGDKITIVRGKFPGKINSDSEKSKEDEDEKENKESDDENKNLNTEKDSIEDTNNSETVKKKVSLTHFSKNFEKAVKRINKAFERKEYRLALVILRKELRKKYNLKEKFIFYKMKGSVHFLLQQNELAIQSFEQALEIDPSDQETKTLKDHIQNEAL